MMHRLIAIIFCSMIFVCGCKSTSRMAGSAVSKRHAQFGVGDLPDGWGQRSFRGADLFFAHKEKNAAIAISSQCEKFSDSPLEALTAQILVGMGPYNILSQERMPLADREGLISEVDAKLDGVRRYLKIMVLRKNRCIFDAVFSASEYSKELVSDFDAMLNTFWAEAEL